MGLVTTAFGIFSAIFLIVGVWSFGDTIEEFQSTEDFQSTDILDKCKEMPKDCLLAGIAYNNLSPVKTVNLFGKDVVISYAPDVTDAIMIIAFFLLAFIIARFVPFFQIHTFSKYVFYLVMVSIGFIVSKFWMWKLYLNSVKRLGFSEQFGVSTLTNFSGHIGRFGDYGILLGLMGLLGFLYLIRRKR